jgi:uncharacterized membrane protein YdfJ with MMPL/SSD domain
LIWDTVLDGLENDLLLGDGISIPSALLVLCLALKSFRFGIIPLISVAASILVIFLVMLPIANVTHVSSVAPNLIMSLTVALSVDYSLFILSRFREETRKGLGNRSSRPITAAC